MILQYSPWVIPFLLSAVATAALAMVSWHFFRGNPVSRTFMFLMIAAAAWSLGDSLQILAVDLPTNLLLNTLTYPAIVSAPVAFLLVILYYIGWDSYLTRRTIALLFAVPALVVVLVATNPYHHLYYTGLVPVSAGGSIAWQYLHGPLFWIAAGYEYLIMITAFVLIIRQLVIVQDIYRRQLLVLLIASLLPFALNISYVLPFLPFAESFDITPVSFSVAGLIIAPGIFRYRLLSLMPVSSPLIFSAMRDGVIVIDQGKQITDLNPAAERILKHSLQEVRGGLAGAVLPDLVPVLGQEGDGNEEFHQEIVLRDEGGDKHLAVDSLPVLSGAGIHRGRLIILKDITIRRNAEVSRAESERKYRELVDLLPEVVFECDTDGRIIYANRNAFTFFRVGEEELQRGINLLSYIIPEDRARVSETIGHIILGERLTGSEFTAIRSDGSTFPVLIVNKPVEKEGKIVGMRGILIDMTERRNAERALKEAMKKLSLLNSITRHDILNQLSALLSYITLTEEMVTEELPRNYLTQCEHIATSIQEHVEFARDYQDIGVQSPVWQDLRGVIRRVGESQGSTRITIHDKTTEVEIFADPLFEKVIFNLIDNAARHGEHATEITFTTAETPAGFLIVSEDNGLGIPAADKVRLFQRGFGKNTGLGLFLSREILGITGIRITENGVPGKGARFEILVAKESYRFRSGG